jgi:hypothetical protein
MAPKRRRDAVAREIAKTYTFGRSQIDNTDVGGLVKNRMVGADQPYSTCSFATVLLM